MTVEEQSTMRAIQNINRKMPEITLRDLFAMSALNGIVSSGLVHDSTPKNMLSATAYEFADAMLEARGGKSGK